MAERIQYCMQAASTPMLESSKQYWAKSVRCYSIFIRSAVSVKKYHFSQDDAILSDELNHASIIDGIRLCKANKYRYKHMDMADLEEKLQDAQVPNEYTYIYLQSSLTKMILD